MKKKVETRLQIINIRINQENQVSEQKLIEALLQCIYECENNKKSKN